MGRYPEMPAEVGTVRLAGKEFPVSRIITEQKDRYIDVPGGYDIRGNVWELVKEEGQEHNPAFVQTGEGWIIGHTVQRRWPCPDGRPERQTVFVSNDGKLRFVVSSERITV